VRDPHFCKEIVKGIDDIFHLAALIAIPYSYVALILMWILSKRNFKHMSGRQRKW
jgi:hypothetical protein